jgi:SpoIIAA-like
MPVIVTVDHSRREVSAVCVGPITLSDSLSQLKHEARERGLSYRKIVDTRGSGFELNAKEAQQIAEALRELSQEHRIGPAAVVVSSDAILEMTRAMSKLVESFCEVRAFRDEKEARVWLASRAI